jgi:hypothetical protein
MNTALTGKTQIKRYKKIFSLSLFLFFVTLVARIFCANQLVVKNKDLRDLHQKKVTLEKEISNLTFTDSRLSSLSYVEKRAEELGYIYLNESLLSLDLEAPVPVAALSIH